MIGLNDYVSLKGMSGSSRGAELIRDVLGSSQIVMLGPESEPSSRVFRLLAMLYWDNIGVIRAARRKRAKTVVHLANTGVSAKDVRSIVLMHDTMVLDHPQLFDTGFVTYARLSFPRAIRHATVVVTPSEHSKRAILRRWPHATVMVIPWPAPSQRQPPVLVPHASRSERALIVSSADKHKRLPMAVEMIAAMRDSGTRLGLDLVTRRGNDMDALMKVVDRVDGRREWITLHTDVDETPLKSLYQRAFCLLVPSLDEGFCLPAIEAAQWGTPVIHADRGALPEVVPSVTGPSLRPTDDKDFLNLRLGELLESPERWHAAHSHALSRVELFSRERFKQQWVDLLEDVLRCA